MIFRLLFLLLFATTAFGQPHSFRLPAELPEASGLYYAGPDSLWWLNDGGHGPHLWLTDERGRLLDSLRLPGARNRDWEDLTHDDRGRLYIGDFGNNQRSDRPLQIYIYDPASRRLDSLLFNYPGPGQDTEAFFWRRDSLHLFTKDDPRGKRFLTRHYVLPARPGTCTAVLRDSLALRKRVVTGGAVSPDGQTVVLSGYRLQFLFGFIPLTPQSVFIIRDFPDTRFLQGRIERQRIPLCLKPRQYEAIDFLDDQNVLVGTERTIIFRQRGRRVRLKYK